MDAIATPIEDILDRAEGQISLWLAGHTLTSARFVSWDRAAGLLVCRGGNGFTDEDVHYIRVSVIQGVTLRVPAPRPESDRLGVAVREALRQAAGYPLSLAIRPDAFVDDAEGLAAWLKNVVASIQALEAHREALQSQVDQILLREGDLAAVLGGSTLILEARPGAIPAVETIRGAIAPLLL